MHFALGDGDLVCGSASSDRLPGAVEAYGIILINKRKSNVALKWKEKYKFSYR